MRSALARLPAVYQVGIDVDRDEAYVSYDARALGGDVKAAAAPMVAAVATTGFRPWLKGPGWPEPLSDDAELRVLPR